MQIALKTQVMKSNARMNPLQSLKPQDRQPQIQTAVVDNAKHKRY
jgi:hypothetical protein